MKPTAAKKFCNGTAVSARGEGAESLNRRSYPSYKESGVEWLGSVPSHWEVLAVKRLSLVLRGASPRPIDDPKYFDEEGEYAWTRITDVSKSGGFLRTCPQRLSDLGASQSVKLEPGSLFLSIAATVGKPCITGIKACIHDGFVYFPFLKENPKYLFYVFDSGELYKGLGKLGTQLNLNSDTVGAIKLSIPCRDEQDEIVSFLDRETARIDNLIAEKQKFIDLLKEKRQALISHVVTKGLDPKVKMKDSGIEWIGEVPEHWNVSPLKHVIESIESGTSVNAADTPADEYKVGVLKTSCVYGGEFKWEENKTVIEEDIHRISCQLKKGTLIVSRMNTPDLVGSAGIVNHAPSNIYLPDRLWQISITDDALPKFIHLWTQTPAYRAQVKISCAGTSSSMQNLSQDKFNNFVVPLPPLTEQSEILKDIEQRELLLNKVIDETETSLELLKEHRTALISAAVTGKIDVRDQQ